MTVRFAKYYVIVIVPMMIIMFRMITTTNNNNNDSDSDSDSDNTNTSVNYSNSVTTTTASTLARIMGCRFRQHINENRTFGNSARITNEGRLRRDRDTPIWSMFSDAFGVSYKEHTSMYVNSNSRTHTQIIDTFYYTIIECFLIHLAAVHHVFLHRRPVYSYNIYYYFSQQKIFRWGTKFLIIYNLHNK
jgi:hypothetical protein